MLFAAILAAAAVMVIAMTVYRGQLAFRAIAGALGQSASRPALQLANAAHNGDMKWRLKLAMFAMRLRGSFNKLLHAAHLR